MAVCLKKQEKPRPTHLCPECEAGKKIAQGREDFDPPGKVIFIELNDFEISAEQLEIEPRGGNMMKDKQLIENERWGPIPKGLIRKITPHEMRKYWKNPVIKTKQKGKCPNCLRPDLATIGLGVCCTCREHVHKKTGIDLLLSLNILAERLGGISSKEVDTTMEPEPETSKEQAHALGLNVIPKTVEPDETGPQLIGMGMPVVIVQDLFSIEINGCKVPGFKKTSEWNGLVKYENERGFIITNETSGQPVLVRFEPQQLLEMN